MGKPHQLITHVFQESYHFFSENYLSAKISSPTIAFRALCSGAKIKLILKHKRLNYLSAVALL